MASCWCTSEALPTVVTLACLAWHQTSLVERLPYSATALLTATSASAFSLSRIKKASEEAT